MIRSQVYLNILLFIIVSLIFIYTYVPISKLTLHLKAKNNHGKLPQAATKEENKTEEQFNVWLIFVKVTDRSSLQHNFHNYLCNVYNVSSVPLTLNIIVDSYSKNIALNQIKYVEISRNITINFEFYYVEKIVNSIRDIINIMTPYFSSKPGTYYSDALFYLSLGLHRFAPMTQQTAVMMDCDVMLKDDIGKLFSQINNFRGHLFGLAPELSPVYKHTLYSYKRKYNTSFGEFFHPNQIYSNKANHPNGFPGYNSGVVLFNLTAIRESEEYILLTKKETVDALTKKYKFKGHLGDQDFFTLIGYEYPHIIYTLNCGFNRQLCTWWRDRGGYQKIFDDYFKCSYPTVVLHGNCKTKIPA